MEKQSNRKLKALRTDNGGEYTSNKFEKYLRDEEIRHEKTVPKMPEQNGVAERLNRTLVESARCMLLDAKFSKHYWAEAVSTPVYLKNCCPTKSVQGKTPYKAWHGELTTSKYLGVMLMPIFPRMSEESLTQKQENVFCLDMVKRPKATDSMMSLKRKYYTAEMCNLTKSPRTSCGQSSCDVQVETGCRYVK